jgi:hypothetical protein
MLQSVRGGSYASSSYDSNHGNTSKASYNVNRSEGNEAR